MIKDSIAKAIPIQNGSATLSSTTRAYGQLPCQAGEVCLTDPTTDQGAQHFTRLCQQNMVKDGGSASGVIYGHDAYNNLTDQWEFDYGSAPAVTAGCPAAPAGGFVRHTNLQYSNAPQYLGANIVSLLNQRVVEDASHTTFIWRSFKYDDYTSTPLAATSAVQHDDTYWGQALPVAGISPAIPSFGTKRESGWRRNTPMM